jgi:hypothetical protein
MNWLMKALLRFRLGCARLLRPLRRQPAPPSRSLALRDGTTRLPFIEGVNLPWLSYGGDFGANAWSPGGGVAAAAKRQELRRHFRGLRLRGAQAVRWFLLCDGRSGIRFTRAGTPMGPDDRLFADMDAALAAAAENDLKIIFVLLDFLWFGAAAAVGGVQVRGRGGAVAGGYKQRALRRRVLRPLLRRYGGSPAVLAWDIVNEPEWATRGLAGDGSTAMPFSAMRRFIRRTARLVHRCTRQLATVGLASAAGLPLARGCGLDFYQVHWYDRWQEAAPLERPVEAWGLDRPLLLGEFPTRNSGRGPEAIVAAARDSGYCGALAWSWLAADRSSGLQAGNRAAPG